jgi:pilus assembly protein CpaF
MPDVSMYIAPIARPAVVPELRIAPVLGGAARHELKTAVHHELIRRMDLEKLSAIQADDQTGRQRLMAVILQLISEQNAPLSAPDRDRLAQDILDEVFGLGPLEPLLHDPTVSDILVNTYKTVYVERRGVIEKTNIVFKDEAHLMHIIDKIVSAVGRRIDESSPMVDARLMDGSRVNVVIPPLAVDGPLLYDTGRLRRRCWSFCVARCAPG